MMNPLPKELAGTCTMWPLSKGGQNGSSPNPPTRRATVLVVEMFRTTSTVTVRRRLIDSGGCADPSTGISTIPSTHHQATEAFIIIEPPANGSLRSTIHLLGPI